MLETGGRGCNIHDFVLNQEQVVEQKYFVLPCKKESESFYILPYLFPITFLESPNNN